MRTFFPPQRLQDLSPEAAHFCLGVEHFIRDYCQPDLAGESLLISYSGGADSRALLYALHYLSPRLGASLHAATLDHGLRPEGTDEAAEAAVTCAALAIPFHTARRDVAALAQRFNCGIEEAGRVARQKFLEETRLKTGCSWVAVGHQLNDLAEDSLMRMLRGTGWPALAGMEAVCEERRILRPLLLTPRAELECFLSAIGETWHEDSTNQDEAYLRNRIRHAILPSFFRENPSFLVTVADRWKMARADASFFSPLLDAIPETHDGGIFITRDALAAVFPAIRLRKYKKILAELGPGQASALSLQALDAAWSKNEGGKRIVFPEGKSAIIRSGGIVFLAGSERKRRPH